MTIIGKSVLYLRAMPVAAWGRSSGHASQPGYAPVTRQNRKFELAEGAAEEIGDNVIAFPSMAAFASADYVSEPSVSAARDERVSLDESIAALPNLSRDVKTALRALVDSIRRQKRLTGELVETDAQRRLFKADEIGFGNAASILDRRSQRDVARIVTDLSFVYGRMVDCCGRLSVLSLHDAPAGMRDELKAEADYLMQVELKTKIDLAIMLDAKPVLRSLMTPSFERSFGELREATASELERMHAFYGQKVGELPAPLTEGAEPGEALMHHIAGLLELEHAIAVGGRVLGDRRVREPGLSSIAFSMG